MHWLVLIMTQTVNLYLHDSTKFCYVTQRCYALLTFFRFCKPFEPFSPFFSALLFLLQVQFTRIMNVKHLPALSGTNLCCHIHDIIFCFLLIIIFNWVILRNGVLLQISWVVGNPLCGSIAITCYAQSKNCYLSIYCFEKKFFCTWLEIHANFVQKDWSTCWPGWFLCEIFDVLWRL